jgi:hypothetical protein
VSVTSDEGGDVEDAMRKYEELLLEAGEATP